MNPTVAMAPTRAELTLSQKVTVTVMVEGVAPLRVELPKVLLAESSIRVWSATLAGPAKRVDLSDGKQRWTQEIVLDPYLPTKGQRVEFNALKVNDISTDIPVFLADVTTQIQGTGDEHIRPVTGIEVTPVSVQPASHLGWWLGSGAGVVLMIVIGLFLFKRKPKPVILNRIQLFHRDLSEIQSLPVKERWDRFSTIIREWIERLTETQATRMTTAELAGKLEFTVITEALTVCDRVKFAGYCPDEEEWTKTRKNVVEFVEWMG